MKSQPPKKIITLLALFALGIWIGDGVAAVMFGNEVVNKNAKEIFSSFAVPLEVVENNGFINWQVSLNGRINSLSDGRTMTVLDRQGNAMVLRLTSKTQVSRSVADDKIKNQFDVVGASTADLKNGENAIIQIGFPDGKAEAQEILID